MTEERKGPGNSPLPPPKKKRILRLLHLGRPAWNVELSLSFPPQTSIYSFGSSPSLHLPSFLLPTEVSSPHLGLCFRLFFSPSSRGWFGPRTKRAAARRVAFEGESRPPFLTKRWKMSFHYPKPNFLHFFFRIGSVSVYMYVDFRVLYKNMSAHIYAYIFVHSR